MEFLYFLGVLTFLALYNFVEKSYKSNKSSIWHTTENIGKISSQTRKYRKTSQNMWEESKQFEGDIILNDVQKRILKQMNDGVKATRNALQDLSRKWPNRTLVYKIFDDDFSAEQVIEIYKAFDFIRKVSCIKIRPATYNDEAVVDIQGSFYGCVSGIGYQIPQFLNLDSTFEPDSRWGCFNQQAILHELLHILGFFHMHVNPNRDKYVDVIWDNIDPQFYDNFQKLTPEFANDFGLPYDYSSIMHYETKAFSKYGDDTIVPKMAGAEIRPHLPMSKLDIKKLNMLYCR